MTEKKECPYCKKQVDKLIKGICDQCYRRSYYREYRRINKETWDNYHKQYYENNKDNWKAYRQRWLDKQKDK